MRFIRRLWFAAGKLRGIGKYAVRTAGHGTEIDYWRLRARARNVLSVGAASRFSSQVVFERDGAKLVVGQRSFVGRGLMSIADSVTIGHDVLLSWGVTIVDHHAHSIDARNRSRDLRGWVQGRKDWTDVKIGAVSIADHCWIGFDVAILAGVSIGEGAVVGACSVVTRDVEAWTVVAGNPATLVRRLEPQVMNEPSHAR